MNSNMRTTVERLDKPSAYYLGRVSLPFPLHTVCFASNMIAEQNKKRKFNRDRDDRDDNEREPEQEPEDPLKDATTLYVGNLYATRARCSKQKNLRWHQILLHY